MEIDYEIIFTVILLLPLIREGLCVSYKRKYVHKVLVIVKLAQEKSVVRLTDCLDMTIAVEFKPNITFKQFIF